MFLNNPKLDSLSTLGHQFSATPIARAGPNPLFMMKFLLLVGLCLALSACGEKKEITTAESPAHAQPASAGSPPTKDYKGYDQYLYCTINGQPYLAYSEEGHSSAISNSLNMASRTSFSTSADDERIAGATKSGELQLDFFGLGAKGVGTYTSNRDFIVQGHTDLLENGKLVYTRFMSGEGHTLQITKITKDYIEGTFSLDATNEQNAAKVLKFADGHFRLKASGGFKGLKMSADCQDVDVGKMLKDVTK